MMLYRSVKNNQLYVIEHLIRDIRKLNNNADAGIYATPYKHNGESFVFKSKNHSDCLKFVNDNFVELKNIIF